MTSDPLDSTSSPEQPPPPPHSPPPSQGAPRRLLDLLGGLAATAIVVAAIARAATAPLPGEGATASLEQRRQMFAQVAGEEPSMRKSAAHEFPGEPWSQDDDFHQREQQKARSVASARGVRLGDALRALDEGLREGWPFATDGGSPEDVHLAPGVPPCRPRLSY